MEEKRKMSKGEIILLVGLVIFWIIWTFVSYYLACWAS
jgi:uncharacterized membrane protein